MSRLMPVVRVAVAAMLVVGLGGCAKAQSNAPENEDPYTLTAIPGSQVKEVSLTMDAFEDLGIDSEPVRKADGGGAAKAVIPAAAIIYDPAGASWVYTVKGATTFVRQKVKIDHMVGNEAYLTSSPPVGTLVVTVGSPELYGAEIGVGEGE